MNYSIRRVQPVQTGVGAPLGDLELAIMRFVWSSPDRGVAGSEVQHHLATGRPVALTTVLTTLDRLSAKGILARRREGKVNRYHAILTEDQLQRRIVDGVLSSLITRFPRAVAAFFAERGLSGVGTDEASLERLAKRIAALEEHVEDDPNR